MRLVLLFLLLFPGPAIAQDDLRPRPRPEAERCSPDGSLCIRRTNYVADTCAAVEEAATRAGIDVGFFARLIWRESLFDASAISPKGAQGIAQFIPDTARRRGLSDPFNPAEALLVSATYLADLARDFGNEGLAAAAYNSGEARTADFVGPTRRTLPFETRAYVRAITGHSAADWRDAPPEAPDYALAADKPFAEACAAQVRTPRSFRRAAPPPPPAGLIVAAGRRRATVEAFADRVKRENAAVLAGYEVSIVEGRMAGFGRGGRLTAFVGTASLAEAQSLCRRLQRNGAFCQVRDNR